jgi:hypothetical protein
LRLSLDNCVYQIHESAVRQNLRQNQIGWPPISIIGFGRSDVSSLILVPNPPASSTAFICNNLRGDATSLTAKERYS